MRPRWPSTVRTLRNSDSAISRFRRPSATSVAISRSRAVSSGSASPAASVRGTATGDADAEAPQLRRGLVAVEDGAERVELVVDRLELRDPRVAVASAAVARAPSSRARAASIGIPTSSAAAAPPSAAASAASPSPRGELDRRPGAQRVGVAAADLEAGGGGRGPLGPVGGGLVVAAAERDPGEDLVRARAEPALDPVERRPAGVLEQRRLRLVRSPGGMEGVGEV